jgi:hypothetical protein
LRGHSVATSCEARRQTRRPLNLRTVTYPDAEVAWLVDIAVQGNEFWLNR